MGGTVQQQQQQQTSVKAPHQSTQDNDTTIRMYASDDAFGADLSWQSVDLSDARVCGCCRRYMDPRST